MKAAIRIAEAKDVDAIIRLRIKLFRALNEIKDEARLPQLIETMKTFFYNAIKTGDCVTWLAEAGGEDVASGSLTFLHRPPYQSNLLGREAYISNMYTEPARQKRGIATQIVTEIVAFAKRKEAKRIWLHTSDGGRQVYENIGFAENDTYLEIIAE